MLHNILNRHWEGTLASPNMQQTRKIKNRNVECVVDPMSSHLSDPCRSWQTPSNHQLPMGPSMNNCGTKHRVMLPTSKLNSSDFQVWGGRYLLLPLQERVTPASFKNVMGPQSSSEDSGTWLSEQLASWLEKDRRN
jgi:hypothetical protein